jgi:hypothetical protein
MDLVEAPGKTGLKPGLITLALQFLVEARGGKPKRLGWAFQLRA